MEILKDMQTSWRAAWWARLLALLFLFALGVCAYGFIRTWLLSGTFPAQLPGFMSVLLFGYISLVICWVGVTGRVPKFFPIGALKWPFFKHHS